MKAGPKRTCLVERRRLVLYDKSALIAVLRLLFLALTMIRAESPRRRIARLKRLFQSVVYLCFAHFARTRVTGRWRKFVRIFLQLTASTTLP